MYEYCDLKWMSIVGSGIISFLIGFGAFLIPRVATSLIVIFTGLVILILAGILIAESLFLDGGGVPKGILAIIGGLGIILAFMAVLNPDMLIMTAGMMIGVSLIIFGTLMLVTAATIIFDFLIRAVVAFSSFLAIILGMYFVIIPSTSVDIFIMAVGTFLVLYGIVRTSYGIRLRSWQKTCPATYLTRH
jgi:uncharacterized membrane protein HdeD (DUF308 family)